MRAPEFWSHPPGLAAYALAPLGALYGRIAGARLAHKGELAPVPCICVGNFTVGGAGKTPTALAVADRLHALGRAPVFLSRGYGGRLKGPVRVDRQSAREVGDEALLLAAEAPSVIARDRVAGARLAAGLGDVLVLDDGFQNPLLTKDFSLIVVDGHQGVGNGFVFPAGPLRAPLGPQVARTDAVLVIGEGPGLRFAETLGRPVLHAHLQPARSARKLRGARVLGFCGIGRPQKFFTTLRGLGAEIVQARSFGDHHRFTDAEARALIAAAERDDAQLVTTAKDAVRLTGSPALLALAAATKTVRVDLVIEDEESLDDLLRQALRRRAA